MENAQKSEIRQLTIKQLFPINPYSIQQSLATTIYKTLKQNSYKVLIVQSPTGTGKTYSLLVGTCKWLHQNPHSIPNKHTSQDIDKKIPKWLKRTENPKSHQLLEEKKNMLSKIIKVDQAQAQKKKQLTLKRKNFGEKNLSIEKQKLTINNTDDIFDELIDSESEQQQVGQNIYKNNNKMGKIDIQLQQNCLPKIIFVSRTHSQLKQVMQSIQEIKNFSGQLMLNSLELGSKSQLCINPVLNKSKDTNSIHEKCQYLLSHTGCQYYHKLQIQQFFGKQMDSSYELGSKVHLCPYYGTKNLIKLADLICVPYISILKKDIRQRLNINLNNSIIIFDEAHNVIDQQLSFKSPQIKYKVLANICSSVQQYLQKYNAKLKCKNKLLLKHLIDIIRSLLTVIKSSYENLAGSYRKLNSVQLLLEMNIYEIKIHKLKKYFELSNFVEKVVHFNKQSILSTVDFHVFIEFLLKIATPQQENYTILIKSSENSQKIKTIEDVSIKYLCLNSQTLSQIIKMSRLTIFAGGTMYPLDQYSPIIQKFKTKVLTYSHNIKEQQCQVFCINLFQQNKIIFNYATITNNFSFLQAVLQEFIDKIMQRMNKKYSNQNAGLVIFVQNYNLIEKIMKQLKTHKDIGIMHFDIKGEDNVFQKYQNTLENQKRSILFSVMGGKLSEGINFSDQLARTIAVFGLPYANIKSPQLQQTMKYFDKKGAECVKDDIIDIDKEDCIDKMQMNGDRYYQSLCLRTLNQTIGRGIRHHKDKADIYLVDCRFEKMKNKLSKWLAERTIIIPKLESL